jgi:hypothetical protein
MEKKMRYDFELKLKFLNFFYLLEVIPLFYNFSPKMDYRGRMILTNTVIRKLILLF